MPDASKIEPERRECFMYPLHASTELGCSGIRCQPERELSWGEGAMADVGSDRPLEEPPAAKGSAGQRDFGRRAIPWLKRSQHGKRLPDDAASLNDRIFISQMTDANAGSLHVYYLILNSDKTREYLDKLQKTNDFKARVVLLVNVCSTLSYSSMYGRPEPIDAIVYFVERLTSTDSRRKWFRPAEHRLLPRVRTDASVDREALAQDASEIQADFHVAVLTVLSEQHPEILFEIARRAADSDQVDQMHPRVRERLAAIFENYAARLRAANSQSEADGDAEAAS